MKQLFWWNGLKEAALQSVKDCSVCQAIKHPNTKPVGLLKPSQVPMFRWESVSIDFIVSCLKPSMDMMLLWCLLIVSARWCISLRRRQQLLLKRLPGCSDTMSSGYTAFLGRLCQTGTRDSLPISGKRYVLCSALIRACQLVFTLRLMGRLSA